MSDIREIFEKKEEISHEPLIDLEFDKLQGYGVNGKVLGMDLVLKSKGLPETQQLEIFIPKVLIEQYKLIVQATMLDIKLDIDVMDDYQSVIGIYLRKVIFLKNKEGEREAWVFTLSDMGEAAYYRVSDYLAAIYAIRKHLPILAEKQVLKQKSIANTLETIQEHFELRQSNSLTYPEKLLEMIKHEEDNAEVLSRLTNEILAQKLSIEELEHLRTGVIQMEKYEWAQKFTDIIKMKEDEEE